jgi:hypothetical protein
MKSLANPVPEKSVSKDTMPPLQLSRNHFHGLRLKPRGTAAIVPACWGTGPLEQTSGKFFTATAPSGNCFVTPVGLVPRLDRGIDPESTANGCRIKSGMTPTARHDGNCPVIPRLDRGIQRRESSANGCRIKSGMTLTPA